MSAPQEFRNIQALRGLAACMVLVFHSTQIWSELVGKAINTLAWRNGGAGVDIFFVISGFVMTVSSIGKESAHPARNFLERRLIRIVPLYWIITTVALVKVVAQARPEIVAAGRHATTSLAFVVSSYLFIPIRNVYGESLPLLPVGWTLNFEMFFYLLFALALALRLNVVRFLVPMLVVLAAVGMVRHSSWPTITGLASPLLLEFLAGVLLGYAVFKGFRLDWRVSLALGVAGLAALVTVPAYELQIMRVLAWGVPAVLVVQCGVMLEERFGRSMPRWALLLGDASYSIYLFHLLVLAVVAQGLKRLHILNIGVVRRRDEAVTILICSIVSIFASLLLYWWVEDPLNRGLRRRLRLRQDKRAARSIKNEL